MGENPKFAEKFPLYGDAETIRSLSGLMNFFTVVNRKKRFRVNWNWTEKVSGTK